MHGHPLAATVLLISSALKKLRAVHFDPKRKRKFVERYLWRGMRNLNVPPDLLVQGGVEAACMSTSEDLNVVAAYAKSSVPLLFRLKIESPMELGSDISWLSMYPEEKEVLFPPLTYLRPVGAPMLENGCTVITVHPRF